ncbi:MAG TPA: sigma-70 family RNA polymerase sigma factor [Acidimicrobiia bacterium]|nr:sigma-70 family RNA polymerase sigma factor [Acidimicrobiia bacterium]
MTGETDSQRGASGWPPSRTDVEQARDGDNQVLGAILVNGFPRLVAFYRGVGLPNADSEELASEAVEGMIKSIRRLREPDAFEGWFWTIARNRLRTNLRRRGRIERELEYGPVEDPASIVVSREEHVTIRMALEQLSIRDREILWLREVEQLTHEEIATRLMMRPGAVRVAALRARRRLEEFYEAQTTSVVEQ